MVLEWGAGEGGWGGASEGGGGGGGEGMDGGGGARKWLWKLGGKMGGRRWGGGEWV